MNASRRVRPLLLAGLLAWPAACSTNDGRTPVYPVKGSVFFEGRPAAGAVVILHPISPQPPGTPLPRARVASDGSFVLTTYVTGDGAPAGEHAVAVTWKQATEYAEVEGPDLIPVRFGDPKTSGLKAVVESRSNELSPYRLRRTR